MTIQTDARAALVAATETSEALIEHSHALASQRAALQQDLQQTQHTLSDAEAEVNRLTAEVARLIAEAGHGVITDAEHQALLAQLDALHAQIAAMRTAAGPGDTKGFTEPEAASLRSLWLGLLACGSTIRGLSFVVRDSGAAPNVVGPIIEEVVRMAYECHLALNALLHVVIESDGTPAFTTFDASPRPVRVERARFHLNRAIPRLAAVQAGLTLTHEQAQRARTIHLPQAVGHLKAVNLTLPYDTPLPAGQPKIVGPHGVYRNWQWHTWRASHYTFGGVIALADAYAADPAAAASNAKYYKAFNSWTLIWEQLTKAQLLTASICFSTLEVDAGPFFRLLDALKLMTFTAVGSAAARFHEVNGNLSALTATGIPGVRVLITDSWRHMDDAVWASMVFPDRPNRASFPGAASGEGA